MRKRRSAFEGLVIDLLKRVPCRQPCDAESEARETPGNRKGGGSKSYDGETFHGRLGFDPAVLKTRASRDNNQAPYSFDVQMQCSVGSGLRGLRNGNDDRGLSRGFALL